MAAIEYLSLNETNALLKAIDDIRDRAIVILFLNTGIFITELTSLKFDAVNWNKKTLSVPGTRKREIS
ncbi:MAG: tyrosine-type recombinase/integrase, partial [bacterium]